MSNTEYFDVVNADDQVVDRLPRSEVHRRRLFHRAVHVFVFRSNGLMLIHRRTDDKEEFPSVWTSSASGHVSSGETYDKTAPRELHEELEIIASPQPLRKFSACAATSMEFTWLYSVTSDAAVVPDPAEIAAIEWCEPDEIFHRLQAAPHTFSPAFRVLFNWYFRQQR